MSNNDGNREPGIVKFTLVLVLVAIVIGAILAAVQNWPALLAFIQQLLGGG